ncbi:hypothetical protein [Mycobacteroides abscessus]|uniref:hypothetical protein n=1 Tax=Mycobacteroides abscessus TaxID=36809 RepID=UPI00092A498E|nr:hypothetical protein [Mycobacteroides abscessus]MBE5440170.1 hypothetical protein [Mycobacteroides abscessus]SID46375.1 Uncharacterised protein [Mycobacteroides abscessus subsp. abscessus]SIG27770.1 Uncharacterised protein [Mycobacteroides abscessus subsp. abscessus]SIK94806.1 Uncharacterised protein [Mycobacteroides abscessus subsp. abscessus]SKU08636.1 Uncharacterised protein [Mycobacteroides abscessus subsp. abscessus]
MNADTQPVGEYPPINRFDLVPIELRVRAVVAAQITCETLASFFGGVDPIPDFTKDLAALMHVPVAADN